MRVAPLVNMLKIMVLILYTVATYPCTFDSRCRCWGLTDVRGVDCSKNNITEIPTLPSNITFLNLSYNCLKVVSNGSFSNLDSLIILDLSHNRLSYFEPLAFVGLENLQNLSLGHNCLKYDSAFPKNIFKPLKSATYFEITFNEADNLYNVPDDVIADVTTLVNLEIDIFNTNVSEPFGEAYNKLTSLRKLKRGVCKLYIIEFTFVYLKYLEFIDISGCFLDFYAPYTFSERKRIKRLDMSNNKFDELSLTRMVTDFELMLVDTLILTAAFDESVTYLPLECFRHLSNSGIKKLFLNENNFAKISKSSDLVELPQTLRTLDFSRNNLLDFYFKMPKLWSLNLQHNALGKFLAVNSLAQKTISQLIYINLSFNVVYKFPFYICYLHPRLEILNLSNNVLTDIHFDVPKISVLRMLDLSNNNITTLTNSKVMNFITNLTTTTGLIVDLSNNTLHCDCRNIPFLQWMLHIQDNFRHINRYKCKLENGTIIIMSDFSRTVMQIEKECASHTLLIVCLSIAIVIFCIIVIGGLVYRYRWKLRYLFYMTKSKYYRYKRLENEKVYKYDAFISYADEDKDFIVKECIPNLEANGDKKLCIHHRDFMPGEDITVNITDAIHESRKTVCIITRHFLESYYCIFEFNMARMESIYSRGGENILFLVFLEQVRTRDLPLVILELVQKQSYIEYPNDEQGNVVFWEKMGEAVG